jgi:hypothetical protein
MRTRLVLAGLLLALMGCSGGPKMVPVSGTVRLDGKPLVYAAVYFNPVPAGGQITAPGPGSLGVTDENGHFTLAIAGTGGTPGALVGEHRVRISTRGVGSGPDENAPPQPERVPAKYNTNTELTFTVPPGGTDAANFDLK